MSSFRTHYVTLYLYSNLIVQTEDRTDPAPNVRCFSCGRLLARVHGRIFRMANTQAPTVEELPVGVPAFETKCPNCNLVMLVIWQ